MADFYIKQGDLLPIMTATLADAHSDPVDLTGATVTLRMSNRATGENKISSGSCVVVDATAGAVSYAWVSGDTDTAADYDAEFRATFLGGKRETFPNDTDLLIRVVPPVG